MNIKKRAFDFLFIVISAGILIGLNEYGLLEKYAVFAFIPIITSYQLGQYSQRKFKD